MVTGASGNANLIIESTRFDIHKIITKDQLAIVSGQQDSAIVYHFDTVKKVFKFCMRFASLTVVMHF
jgi:hypothetical protein